MKKMSNFIVEKCKMIQIDKKRYNKVPLRFHATLNRIADNADTYGDTDEKETIISNKLRQVFDGEHFTLQRHIGLFGTTIFNFKILDNEYTLETLKQAINHNCIGGISPKNLDFATMFMQIILPLSTSEDMTSDVVHLWDNVEPKRDSHGQLYVHPLLEKLKTLVDEQNYAGALAGILRYPYLNQKQAIKQHLVIGFASNSGKSLIHRMLETVYQGICTSKGARPDNKGSVFDVGGWNAECEGKFLVIIGDNNPIEPPSKDFIKNFQEQPLRVRLKGGTNYEYMYKGSSVIITNNMAEHFTETEFDKRIKLINLDKKLSKNDGADGYFAKEEADLLYDVIARDVSELKTFLMKYTDTTNFEKRKKNNYGSNINDEIKLTLLTGEQTVSYKLLNFMYGRDNVEACAKKNGFSLEKERSYQINGVTIGETDMPRLRADDRRRPKTGIDRSEIVKIVHQHRYAINFPQRKSKQALLDFWSYRIETVDDLMQKDNEYFKRFDGGVYFVEQKKRAKSKPITSDTVEMHTAFVASFSTTEKSLHMLWYEMSGIFEKWIVVKTPSRLIDDITGEVTGEKLVALGFFNKSSFPSMYPKEYNEFCDKHKLPCTIEALPLTFSEVITSETFKIDY